MTSVVLPTAALCEGGRSVGWRVGDGRPSAALSLLTLTATTRYSPPHPLYPSPSHPPPPPPSSPSAHPLSSSSTVSPSLSFFPRSLAAHPRFPSAAHGAPELLSAPFLAFLLHARPPTRPSARPGCSGIDCSAAQGSRRSFSPSGDYIHLPPDGKHTRAFPRPKPTREFMKNRRYGTTYNVET